MSKSVIIRNVREAWRICNGVACVYKPADTSTHRLRQMVIANLCRDFNELDPHPPRKFVNIVPLSGENTSQQLQIEVRENLADSVLVSGPAIQPSDVRLSWINYLGKRTSGVTVISVNDGNRYLHKFRESRPLSAYHVKARFGLATDTHWSDGKVWEKATFHHIRQDKFHKLLASIQASQQRKMFEYCGVNPTSQTAYELASRGLLRPAINGPTLIYGLKCIDFKPPDFTLEVHCINEDEIFLATLVHDIGISLKSAAATVQMRCIRHGEFSLENALLRKHWTLEYLMQNMIDCRNILQKTMAVSPVLSPTDKMINVN
nr:EOG090X0AGI [Eulimnadia texana]